MDLFNIGTPEVIVIALIGLLLFGPEDLLKIARQIGGFIRKAQSMWRDVASSLEVDLLEAEKQAAEKSQSTTDTLAEPAVVPPPEEESIASGATMQLQSASEPDAPADVNKEPLHD